MYIRADKRLVFHIGNIHIVPVFPCSAVIYVFKSVAVVECVGVDILDAYEVGGAAMKAADEGESGKMVVIVRTSDDPYQAGTEVKDVHRIANDERLVPREWITKDGTYVTNEFIGYVRPLIQGDVSPIMVDGIPRHLFVPGYQELL